MELIVFNELWKLVCIKVFVYFEVFGVHKVMGFLCNMMEDRETSFGV